MLKIIDYGIGNIQAFLNVYSRLQIPAERATTAGAVLSATHLILPGVGAFDHAMQMLENAGLKVAMKEAVFERGIPILGVCVGMQMLATDSDEGVLPGLNWIPGRIRSFGSVPECADLPIPHMGWNDLHPVESSGLFQGEDGSGQRFYFLHSYFFDAEDKETVAATAYYGVEFDAVVRKGNVYGVQCHPEKSHHWGAKLLRNFSELTVC